MQDWQQIKLQYGIIETQNFAVEISKLMVQGNTLLVTSEGFTKRGISQRVRDSLRPKSVLLCDQVKPNPELQDLQGLGQQFKASHIRNIVALGGGSVIDSAKVLCAMLSQPQMSLLQLLNDGEPVNHVNLIAIPTTAGTGAEVTPFATVWDSTTIKKYSLLGITANRVILDAHLTLSLPRQETLYPALDALSHALESLWNKNRTLYSVAIAIAAIEAICQALPLVLNQADNLPARQALQRAATMAGLAICQTRTALAHAISYPLTAGYGVPHGLACSFTLAAILQEVGHEKLNLSAELADNVAMMLGALQLSRQLAGYIGDTDLIDILGQQLDPSRAGNFMLELDQTMLSRVLTQATREN
ncbi:iron-containing alcohol dehydrogenase [uncultured Paraglaciecola sp.]|uniref:iron-containing alcohol dehydrogenase n=1 Tax=uncultured Paraglaciecola sp. TaxID=1765024 RepID=UPI0026100AFA|nr:iron-containing alcohol dehydrogenase [uncultured Paraglaciecola sp.]